MICLLCGKQVPNRRESDADPIPLMVQIVRGENKRSFMFCSEAHGVDYARTSGSNEQDCRDRADLMGFFSDRPSATTTYAR